MGSIKRVWACSVCSKRLQRRPGLTLLESLRIHYLCVHSDRRVPASLRAGAFQEVP